MNSAFFERASKYFFWISGALTFLAGLPVMLSPRGGLHLVLGLRYFDQSPQLSPLVGHWGMMVSCIGVLLFLAATNVQIRKGAVLFATIEKAYIVGAAFCCMLARSPYASNYLPAVFLDGPLAVIGVWYLLESRRLKQP